MSEAQQFVVPSTLRHACRILVALNERNMNRAELLEATRLNTSQLSQALAQLRRERKIKIALHKRNKDGGHVYAFNDDWTPAAALPPWPKEKPIAGKMREARRAVRSVAAAADLEVAQLPPVVRFRERKLQLLRKLLEHVSLEDRDALLGIIADYQRGGGVR